MVVPCQDVEDWPAECNRKPWQGAAEMFSTRIDRILMAAYTYESLVFSKPTSNDLHFEFFGIL